ncbi:DUF6311 domain-containing protein [Pseudomonas shirazensis]|uniref:DUF6311 domain-containing protein n=1 Tax=Pseudomonas shirazensis TaxID=2745494 RepID=UPI003D06C720
MGLKLDSMGRAGFAFALAFGVFFVLRYFPLDFIAGTNSYWQTEVDDVTQYFAGFNAFFNAPFSYPLLAFNGINYPQGTHATFVDAIPLYAFLLKVFVPKSFAPFNPFGVWIALSFVAQAICAWWILRELQIRSWLALVALVVCMVTMPEFTSRLAHVSLMSQWIVLCALAMYIRCRRTQQPHWWAWGVLLVAGFYVNIYLVVMASAIYVASCLGSPNRFKPGYILRALVPFLIIGVSLFLTILPMGQASVAKEGGFGIFSMNLLSPFHGSKFLHFPNPEMPGQGEGFNYLGLGVLLAFGLSWVLNHRSNDGSFARHKALTVLMVLFAVYALSNEIYLGTSHLVSIIYPSILEPITSQFRASGRFFWPVGYCVVIFTVTLLYRRLSPRLFSASMLALIALQITDLSAYRHLLVAVSNRPATPVITQAAWDEQASSDVQYLYFFPKFKCGRGDQVLQTLMPVMRYASVHNIKINTGYVSRSNANCSSESTQVEIAGSDFTRSLYVFNSGDFPKVEQVKQLFPVERQPECKVVDFAYVCRLDQAEQVKP